MTSERVTFDLADPLRRIEGETVKAHRALQDYAIMGPGRSLRRLADDYQTQDKPPTKRRQTLEKWSTKFAWQDRVALFDLAEFEHAISQYYDSREKWRARRESLLELAWAKVATVLTLWQPGAMVDEAGNLRGSITELMTAVRTIGDQTRIEHEGLPEFARGGSGELSAAINALISRELVRLAGAGTGHIVDVPPDDTDRGGE